MQRKKWYVRLLQAAALGFGLSHALTALAAGPWAAVGPFGGDARSFAVEPGNPRHLYLGTTSSWIYESTDGGSSWQRLARLGKDDDLIVDNLFVDAADPKTVVAGVFQVDERGGGVYISHDSGKHWAESSGMAGQPVLALSQSASEPKIYIAGSLTGVFRSEDRGDHWAKISPPGSTELHEVESVAIDPTDPKTIYAGTWHLPWKTTDGGEHWENVKQGLIDDSDVFSIIIDPGAPSIVYASACSGIYKSLNGGAQFRKVQGIPSTARRTRVLMQDPLNRLIVYAGTTEGLYKTEDGGEAWTRLTGPDVIINDVFVDPRNDQHLLLATDRSGVLESEDGGQTFQASNTGFSQRQVESLLLDRKAPATIYAGVLNDKIYGGVFVSDDGGHSWQQRSDGLAGADVFTLGQTDDGTVFAGTGHGVFRWDGNRWQPAGQVVIVTEKKVRVRVKPGAHRAEPAPAPAPVAAVQEIAPAPVPASAPAKTTWTPVYHPVGRGPKSPARPQPKTRTQPRPRVVYAGKAPAWETVNHETFTKGGVIDARVNELSLTGATWYVATSSGLYRSADQGQNWQGPVNGAADVRFVDAADQTVVAASPESLDFSSDGGKSWTQVKLPEKLTRIRALAVAADQSVWIGGLEGLFYTEDHGQSWKAIANLPLGAISGLSYDPDLKRVLVTSGSSTIIFGVDGTDSRWKWWDAGWKVHEVYSKNGRLVGASLYDGIVVEPEPSAGTPGGSR